MQLEVTGEVVAWRGPAPHHFLRLDGDAADLVAQTAAMVTYGWGMVPVRLRLGSTSWTTSLWPRDGGYMLPLKADVRRREGVALGDVVTVSVEVVT